MNKKLFLKIGGFIGILLLLPILTLAFETRFPDIGIPEPTDFSSFINYLYYFSLFAGSMISFLALMYGGALYLFSGGNPGKAFFAKQQIYASFTGLGILVLSFMILNFLDPNLTVFNLPNIPTISGPALLPNIPPEERLTSYWELPIGELEIDVLNKALALVEPVDLAEPVEDLVKELEDESEQLENLLQECSCSELISDCGAECSELGCLNSSGGDPTQADLCPNLAAIEAQQNTIRNTQSSLEVARESLLSAEIELEIAVVKLGTAKNLLNSCLPSPMDLNTFLGIQDVQGIEKKIFFNNTSSRKHPLTFYCPLDEGLVSQNLDIMNSAISELLTRRRPPVCGGTGTCPEGTGLCSSENMKNYFTDDTVSHNFSAICQRESGGNPDAMNTGCLDGSSLDYSIGLMQINLLAWCSEAITYDPQTNLCTTLDQAKLDECVQTYKDPVNNLEKAVVIFGLQGYGAWGAAYACGIVDGDNCRPDPGPPPPPVGFFNLPMNSGCITCPWMGYRYAGGNCHEGTDYAAAEWTPIYSVAPGIIKGWGNSVSYGYWAAIEHTIPPSNEKLISFYAHMAEPASDNVQSAGVGGYIDRGIVVGYEGTTGSSTGPHLHFVLVTTLDISGDEPYPHFVNSVNPESYLPAGDQCIILPACGGCY